MFRVKNMDIQTQNSQTYKPFKCALKQQNQYILELDLKYTQSLSRVENTVYFSSLEEINFYSKWF